jgi:hypothetical protein
LVLKPLHESPGFQERRQHSTALKVTIAAGEPTPLAKDFALHSVSTIAEFTDRDASSQSAARSGPGSHDNVATCEINAAGMSILWPSPFRNRLRSHRFGNVVKANQCVDPSVDTQIQPLIDTANPAIN